ncbi:ATP-binding protein [Bradyrhizobium sp. LCT2]|uniref:ATP-binding protein n=1 Tax=Bradyrhizobium sp. LCT2 TaxID=2493093 RepID=UPI00210FFCA9|nr:ATP-binding protein [Bradyrhizobium sp. LCT2]
MSTIAPLVVSTVRSFRASPPANGSTSTTISSSSVRPAPGKSWLACALGNRACRDGFSVLYKRVPRLFADLAQARGEGRLARLIAALERVNLLILDDWGPEALTADQRRDLLEIVDDRYDKGSLLITSQVPVSQWHDVIAEPMTS